VPPGSGDAVFLSLVEHVVCPLARAFEPQLVLISAGYDAHREDPLAECLLTEDGYAAMTTTMRRLAAELGAPLGCVLEGGYALGALARSVAATMSALVDGSEPVQLVEVDPFAAEARTRLARWWPSLGEG
jgi:acetoin utilization deacetylase AcuC-like enzyme